MPDHPRADGAATLITVLRELEAEFTERHDNALDCAMQGAHAQNYSFAADSHAEAGAYAHVVLRLKAEREKAEADALLRARAEGDHD